LNRRCVLEVGLRFGTAAGINECKPDEAACDDDRHDQRRREQCPETVIIAWNGQFGSIRLGKRCENVRRAMLIPCRGSGKPPQARQALNTCARALVALRARFQGSRAERRPATLF
jgi:hypothetical protein